MHNKRIIRKPRLPENGLVTTLTIFDLADVADDDVLDKYLNDLAVAYDAHALFAFNARLQTAELSLFPPVVERCDKDDADHGSDDRRPLDPPGLRLRPIVTSWTNQTRRRPHSWTPVVGRDVTLPHLTFGVGRLLHLPSAEAVSVRPNAQPRCNHKVTVIGCEAEIGCEAPATWDC